MKIYDLQYSVKNKWNKKQFPKIDENKSVIFIFGSSEFIDTKAPFLELVKQYPNTKKIGCSSSGEIFGNELFDHTLSIAILEFSDVEVDIATMSCFDNKNSVEIGEKLASELTKKKNLKAVMVLSDGLKVNGSELSKGLNNVLSEGVIVTGGLAGDGDRFEKTWVISDDTPKIGYVSALGFYGDNLVYSHGSQGGWDIFGPERKVTKSEGNILYEIDGKPALDLYKEYLGEKAKELPASALLFPLQIRMNDQDIIKLVRTVLSVDHDKKSLTFAGDIPQGYLAQLMKANFDRLIDGASHAASLASLKQCAKDSEILSIAISCVGRRLVLGERVEEEIEATLSNLPKNTKQIGFYSYGELSPLIKDKPCELHNQTMTLTAIGEKKVA